MFEPCVPIAIPTDVRLVVADDALVLDDALERVLDDEWAREQDERGVRLVNNPILSYLGFDGHAIHGRFVLYRHYIASRRRPDLFPPRLVCAMGISGLTLVEGGLVFARRSARVTCYPNLWELVPSGSIDRDGLSDDGTVDFRAALAAELAQEVNVEVADLSALKPYALIYDPNIRTCDIALALDTGLTPEAFLARARERREDEYQAVECVPFEALDDFVRRVGDAIIPVTHAMLEPAWLGRALDALDV
ncbi:MAG: hypothetical protein KJ042_07815 [Deltaproteobacteria bacterium]|nr:hypothetical protein [Deltaproteobacteria bacterium]